MNTNLVYGALITLAMLTASFALGYFIQGNQQQQLQDKIRDLELYCTLDALEFQRNSTGATGLAYIGGDYFCVYAKDRTLTEVLHTCGHEYYHVSDGMLDPPKEE